MVDQKWRRVQYAQSLIKEFLEKSTTVEAFNILDVSDEEVEFSGQNSKTKKILITDTFLIGALSTFDQKTKNGQQVCRYLNYFGYERVVTLAGNMGYRFPEVSNSKQRSVA